MVRARVGKLIHMLEKRSWSIRSTRTQCTFIGLCSQSNCYGAPWIAAPAISGLICACHLVWAKGHESALTLQGPAVRALEGRIINPPDNVGSGWFSATRTHYFLISTVLGM